MPRLLINVSNRLPVTLDEDRITKSSGGLVAALEGLSAEEYEAKWIGWPGGAVDPNRQSEVERTLIGEHGCIPVFLSEAEAKAHYEGFSNSSVWPLLHYMPNYLRYEPGWWEQYRKVNQRFADKVLEIAPDDGLVWVHDYQLLLVPAMLKAARPSVRVGFFLHTPFPAYDIFRCHPRRRELIEGMLGADLLGFHTFGYLRHFRSAASSLLAVETEITRVHAADGRRPLLGVYPIGINARKFDETLDQPDHAARQEKFRATFQGKQVVLSVERMDYTKGILHRIEAVDLYLGGLENRDEIKFIFVSVPSREGVEEYQELRADVESRIGRLNGKYATLHNSPIHFIHGSVEFADLCALYSIADAAIVTPLIDGMNLVAKEFLACQRDHAAPLILSEFAGAAEELFGALLVNPYNAPAVAESIAQALAMSEEEKQERTRPMRERVMHYDAQRWAKSFIEELAAVGEAQGAAESPDGAVNLPEALDRLANAVASGGRVAMFLDYDGTLREIERDPAAARPNDSVSALFDALAWHHNLAVTIISGRTPEDLESFLDDFSFGLIAEHGASLRRPGSKDWEPQDSQVDYSWKALVLPILRLYEEATPGSMVEEKRTSLVWHYRRVDAEFGEWKANQLAETLSAITANAPVQVRHGKKIVEIVSAQVSKAIAVNHFLNGLSADRQPEMVLCAGDDATDESMFSLGLENLLTVKVGAGPTQAKCRAADPAAFRQFLQKVLGR
jgi:trehalose 6-phosphate synthase/phosphatase